MRKKLFAVIMSVMMMVTFMPAMAFATASLSNPNWNDDFTHVNYTVTDGTDEYTDGSDANRYASADGGSIAKADKLFNGWIRSNAKNGSYKVDYLDFNSSKVYLPKTRLSFEEAKELFGSELHSDYDVDALTFSVPSYVRNASEDWTGEWTVADETKNLSANALYAAGFSFKLAAPAYDFDKQYTDDQTFELGIIPTFSDKRAEFVGMVPSVKITIKKTPVDVTTFNASNYYFKDKFNGYYDGAEHVWEQKAVSGVTSTYELYNTKTGKYEAVDSVKVKNVGTYNVKATAKDSKGKTQVVYATLSVVPGCDIQVGFKTDSTINVAGKFDAKDYLEVTVDDWYNLSGVTVTTGYEKQAKAAKKSIKADEKLIMEYFNAMYDVVVEEGENGYSYATIEYKDLTDTEKAAVEKKYEELLNNYFDWIGSGYYTTAKFKVVTTIDFTKAPLTKTYKYKTLKKKSKSFSIKAKASDGRTLYYKITNGAGKIVINKSTGKVTVKKGLKKGTYKVVVSAIDLNNSTVSNDYQLKIKVK